MATFLELLIVLHNIKQSLAGRSPRGSSSGVVLGWLMANPAPRGGSQEPERVHPRATPLKGTRPGSVAKSQEAECGGVATSFLCTSLTHGYSTQGTLAQ